MTAATAATAAAKLADDLREAAREAGLAAESVAALKRLSGGASKESWAFDLCLEDGRLLPAVLRRQPADLRFADAVLGSVAAEAAVIRVAAAAGVPVPDILFELPPGSSLGDGYAMERIAGETLGARILRLPELERARAGLARRSGEVLAKLHAVPRPSRLGLPVVGPEDMLATLDARLQRVGAGRPVFHYAYRWLRRHLPDSEARVLLHGDFRNGNLVVGPDGLRAVLDWELAHVGVPAADLAWLCVTSWRFQRPELPVGGFGTREELLAGYRAAGGVAIEAAELHAWEVCQTLNWGLMCAGAGLSFVEGSRSVEGAVIARRASETEFDLLRLLAPAHAAWREAGDV